MSGWDIDPVGVQAVLEKTVEFAKKIEPWGKDYAAHLQSSATSAGTLYMGTGERPQAGLVGAALAEFAEKTQTDLATVAARAGASLTGASEATKAYLNGDLEMAAEAQREALKTPKIDMPGKKGG